MRSIRPLAAEDAAAVSRLAAALNAHFGVDEPPIPEDRLAELLAGPKPFLFGFLAEADGAPVGYALCQDFFDTDTGTMATWLLDLYIDPARRGQGLGRRMLAAVARDAAAKDRRMVGLAVYRGNPARRLYERLGAALPEEALVYELRDAALTSLAGEAL